jgi:quercetin dioxygenase-like cupin family protein
MAAIFHVNEDEFGWSEYASESGPAAIRFKALTAGASGVPPVQYIEYGPGQTDPVHQHDVGEFFIVMNGEMSLDDAKAGPGGVFFVPAHTDYAVRAGDEGVRYFRVVVG